MTHKHIHIHLGRTRDASIPKLRPEEQRRHDMMLKRYEGMGPALSDREMEEFRELHRRHVEGNTAPK